MAEATSRVHGEGGDSRKKRPDSRRRTTAGGLRPAHPPPAPHRLHRHEGRGLLGASTLPFLYNVWISRRGPLVGVDDPWGWGRSLEWATSCPPPRHNFVTIPRIRSESPAFDLHHPEIAALDQLENVGPAEKSLAGGKEAGK